jgi:type VI secretion system protein ImpL
MNSMNSSSVTGIAVKLGVPLALAVAVLWAVDRYVSPDAAKKILSVLIIFAGALLLIWLLVWVVRKFASLFSSARARNEMARNAAALTGITPQEKSELESLQGTLNQALKVIRESKLAKGHKASEALYSLPWILLLGPSQSGKTAALQMSGVDFAYSTAELRKSRKGAVGEGCEYWFSRAAVMLDLSGRIAVEEEESEVFKGFLDQLKRARKERPLDGVVVLVSINEILKGPQNDSELLADRLRQRFDEMIRRMGIRFPIYILFTKCDQIDGFAEFFGNFHGRERTQIWGATIAHDQRKRMSAEEIFATEFDRLAATLSSYRLQLMAAEKDPARLPRIYGFPGRFAALRRNLEAFVGTLLQPTPYSERPMFRGFYFTGTTIVPEGRPAVQEPIWDPGRQQAVREQSGPAKSYFLGTLFPRVIFADRPLVKASVDTRLRRRLWLDVAFFTTLVVCVVFLVGMIYSFSGNRTLIESTRLAALRLTDAGWNGKQTSDLMAMQQLRERVDELDRYEVHGPSWTLRWGLYSGSPLAEAGRKVYFRRLRESFIVPTAAALRRKLYDFSTGTENAANYSEFYSYLKAYLMMTAPLRCEPSFLNNVLAPLWKGLAPPDAEGVALDQLRFYSQQLSRNDPELQISADNSVVDRARKALSQYPPIERIFTRLKDEGNRKYQPFTLAQATGGKSLQYLNSSHDVPGVFTEAGWSGYFKNAVGQASKEAAQDDWVLGPAARSLSSGQTTDADYDRLLREKYFVEYSDEWQKFLEGLSVRPLADLTEARAALDSFSQQDSALSRLLLNVAANTMLRKEPEKGASIASLFSSALATLGLSTRINRAELIDTVADQFQPLHDLVTSPDGGKSPSMIAQYISSLGKVQVRLESLFGAGVQWDQVKAYVDTIANNLSSNEFQETYRLTALINRQCTTRSTQPIGPFLEQPLRQTWAAILRDAGYRLDGLWRTQISDNFRRELQDGFPFNPSGRDIPLAVLSQSLRPRDGTLDVFYDKELKMFLSQAGDGYAPRTLIGAQVAFSPSFLQFLEKANTVRQALFTAGSPDISVSFDLTPDSTPGVTESLLEIDGQRLRYRNEPPVPYALTWPAKSGAPQARLSISLEGSGEHPSTQTFEGEWALFRLLSQARVVAQSQTTYTLTWSLPGSDGRRRDVRYRLQARGFRNPFAADFFRGFVCPERVTQPPSPSLGEGTAR